MEQTVSHGAASCTERHEALCDAAFADPWNEPHPETPYLPKPERRPAGWLVEHPPVNPNASPEAKALLQYLYRISGRHTLTGQHNFPGRREFSTERVTRRTGKTPALYGSDLGFAAPGDKDTAYERRQLVQELIRRWEDGSVITLCWHAVRPIEDEPVTFGKSVQGRITDAEFDALLTPGTSIHQQWCIQVDRIAESLGQLQDARVPVLWRPYHEINGDWFWWNGRRGGEMHGSKQLYRKIYDRFVHVHHLDHLLWVWNPDRPVRADRQFVDYFPGSDVVDVLALDCYGAYEQGFYDDLNALSGGKVLAIGETSEPPALETYSAQPKWAYYMQWAVDTPADGGPRLADLKEQPELQAMVSALRMVSLNDPLHQTAMADARAPAA